MEYTPIIEWEPDGYVGSMVVRLMLGGCAGGLELG
jgi:hypothetical protein